MEAYEHRVINGLLKAGAAKDPGHASNILAQDVEIVVAPDRATEDDLWPAIWGLAAVLERQFSGQVLINAGLGGPLRQPARLGSRCHFVTSARPQSAAPIYLGLTPPASQTALSADARGGAISYGSLLHSSDRATPISCFAIAGYLGFAALATAAGIPPYREEYTTSQVSFSSRPFDVSRFPEQGMDFVGLGHLGQAYLALLFFITAGTRCRPRTLLIDKGAFEDPNSTTQILIEEQSHWLGENKAEYLKQRACELGWNAHSEVSEITWDWHRINSDAKFAILGLDRFDPRRMAISGGYSWVFDAGLGASFLSPRMSWHSIQASNSLARRLFPDDDSTARPKSENPSSSFIKDLANTPGCCGLLTYEGVQASAPSMGLLAAAFLWSEIGLRLSGVEQQIRGLATIWSPILPHLRTPI